MLPLHRPKSAIHLIACISLVLHSCFFNDGCETGEGETVTRPLDLETIESITFGIAGNLVIRRGAQQQVTIEGQSNILDIVKTRVDNGNWNVVFDKCVKLNETITLTVTVPTLSAVVLSGAGTVQMADTLVSENFRVLLTGTGIMAMKVDAERTTADIIGSGTIEMEGSTDFLQISLDGSGTIDTYRMTANSANVEVGGSGEIFLEVRDELNVVITGAGNVTYRGNPSINSNVIGSGQIFNGN